MTDAHPAADYAAQLKALDPELIGVRLEVARLRKYPNLSGRAVGRKLSDQYPISYLTYYWHERGSRAPIMPALRVYAEFFDIPTEYLLFGHGAEIYEAEARAIAREKKKILRADLLRECDPTLSGSVNQPLRNGKFHLPSTANIRFIVKLMATDLENIAKGKLTLADISGETSPVDPYLELSDEIAWWKIPDYDHSMAGAGEAALPPGTRCLIDFKAPIEPGKFVVAVLATHGEPIVRQYVSDRRWTRGARFRLEALNPNSETIQVDGPSDCLLIVRVVFSGSPR